MINRVKTKSMTLLVQLLPVVILATLPSAAVAQACPSVDSIPEPFRHNVGLLHDVLDESKSRSASALTRLEGAFNTPEVSPELSLGDFFEQILLESVAKVSDYVPGANTAKDTLVGLLDLENKNRAAFDSRKRRDAHDWVEREKLNLANIYNFNIATKLHCAYGKKYLSLPVARRDDFIAEVGEYAHEIGNSIKHENQLEIEFIEYWINNSFRDFGHADGFLIARVEFDANGIAVKSLELASSTYSQQIGHRLNILLEDPKRYPFDLDVYKLILFHDEDYYQDIGVLEQMVDANRVKGLCEPGEQCIAAAFLNKSNKVVFPPIEARVRSKLESLKLQQYHIFNKFTK